MNSPLETVLVFVMFIVFFVVWAVLMFRGMVPRRDEDAGAEYDANIHYACCRCGRHISGPANGVRVSIRCHACLQAEWRGPVADTATAEVILDRTPGRTLITQQHPTFH